MPIVEIQNIWFQKVQFGMTVITTDVAIFHKEERQDAIDDFGWGTGPKPVVMANAFESKASAAAISPTPEAGQSMSILLTGAGKKRKAGETTVTLVKDSDQGDKKQKK
jgi:hypothetical protein